MESTGDLRVFLILIPIFVVTGAWLFYYSRRRSGMMREFARRHGLVFRPGHHAKIESTLETTFRLESPYARGFSNVYDAVENDGVALFRVTELLDLNPHGQAQNTHFGRIAALFDTRPDSDFFVLADLSGVNKRLPTEEPLGNDPGYVELDHALADNPPPQPVSVTFKNGKGLAYLEPPVTGLERDSDLDYLYALAARLKK